MELYDAFSQGVEPGGLRTKNEIKILICYLICKFDSGITKQQLCESIISKGLANYFEVNQALSDVIKNGNIRSELDGEQELLFPTTLGKANTAQLEGELPYSVKEAAFHSVVNMITRLKRERENKIEITPCSDGYNVSVSIMDNDDKLMSVTLFVADSEQAETVKENFLRDPVRVYSSIVALLMT